MIVKTESSMTDFKTVMERYRRQIEEAIFAAIPPHGTRPDALHAAIRHSLEAGGKRIRPIVLVASAHLLPDPFDPIPAAVAIEWLHTYTLVHDDLPAMDNSPLRRGQPSVHVAFDEATAILAGDALLTMAFERLGTAYRDQPEIGLALVRELAIAAGSQRLIGGQAEDTAAENRPISASDLDYIHLNKTAALLEAAGRMGLICGRASPEVLDHMQAALRAVGLAFQIQDDILDVTSSEEAMGKAVRADAANAKNTYVAFHGLDVSRQKAAALTEEALDHLRQIPGDTRFLEALFRSLLNRQT